ncbi:type II toxin-antitoxin system VapC family toxin [Hyperthermus butylicus]|uniref:Conserved archaeal protein n=1 Tax=Hyperthermus butylicus (strain DSM 5456 / JCM 9403 / PLM1-5) TaxID=415426 RepID=A2BKV3_HYPBU|nr:type II toxin-antitoxin system VapC family toxin [Hyperthermus butylicus]ABM80614.1 conserved archaeal protein [Hyperthermus butylicus DSM 5456]
MKAFLDTPLLVYLNTIAEDERRLVYESFYLDILSRYKLYTDVLVLDELIYVSKRKYGIPYSVTLDFIEAIVLPYVTVIGLGEDEYREAARLIAKLNLKPSDALHVAAMKMNGIRLVISEDKELDKVPDVKRVWLTSSP